ncbi:MAG: putative metal-binding motif-containing protein, partial [Myxococcales bacterium]|nr:putative metal-binding motif-containing protein [Myxococcales bacterium]
MHRLPRFVPIVLTALILVGCSDEEIALLLTADSEDAITSLDILVVSTDGMRAGDRVLLRKGQPVGRSQASLVEDPLRLAITLPANGNYMVHLVGHSPDGTLLIANRCYAVSGVQKDAVRLVRLTMDDDDGDGFPTDGSPYCLDPIEGGGQTNCKFACPPTLALDCDDTPTDGAAIFPGATEICESATDYDCDGMANEPCRDDDGDGATACKQNAEPGTCDCDDQDPTAYPGAEETCESGVDKNCDGKPALCDRDGDGFEADLPIGGTPDCNDQDPSINPGVNEVCTAPGEDPTDENCNRLIDEAKECRSDDEDGDGFLSCIRTNNAQGCDCDDCNSGIYPGATIVGPGDDGIDQDCDGQTDEGEPADKDGDGFLGAGVLSNLDCDDNDPRVFPKGVETCGNGKDDDCDGVADDSGPGSLTYYFDCDGDGYGQSDAETISCTGDDLDGS